jgi:hypothetical protein
MSASDLGRQNGLSRPSVLSGRRCLRLNDVHDPGQIVGKDREGHLGG